MASISANVGGTWRTLSSVAVNVSGTWRTIQQVWVNVAGTWRQVYVSFTATVTGASASGATASHGFTPVLTTTGGTPSAYSWVIDSQNGNGTWTVTSGGSTASPTITVTGVLAQDT